MSTALSSISPPSVPVSGTYSQPATRASQPDSSAQAQTGSAGNTSQDSSSTPKDTVSSSRQQSVEQRQEQRVLQQLSARDREVRQHEMAHQAAGAGITGSVSYSYERGPDGQMYAVGGEVSIDTSAVSGDPRATLEKAEAIIRAAMAPAEPSSQDYRVAASARAMAAEARAELAQMEESEASEETGKKPEQATGTAAEARQEDDAGNERRAEMREAQAESMGRLQRQLVETGVFSRMYPPGTLFSYQV